MALIQLLMRFAQGNANCIIYSSNQAFKNDSSLRKQHLMKLGDQKSNISAKEVLTNLMKEGNIRKLWLELLR